MATANMASAPTLIIIFGDRMRWLSKPADYTSLLECTRRLFLDLQAIKDEEIIFCFKPEWFDKELELDDSTFQHVHDKAQLRIETSRASGFSDLKRPTELDGEQISTKTEPDQKRVKIEQHQQEPIDLTKSPPSTPSNLPAATTSTSLGLPVAETPNLQQSRQDIGTALREGQSDPRMDSAFPPSAHPDRSTDAASVQSRAAVLPPSATTTQDRAFNITALTSDSFPVDIGSPTRHACPTRHVVAEEWVGCNKPWTSTDEAATHQFSVRLLTGELNPITLSKSLCLIVSAFSRPPQPSLFCWTASLRLHSPSERHAIRLTFKSKHVHIATLLKHAVERGYPGPTEQLQFRNAQGFSRPSYHSFHFSGVENNSDVYVFRDDRPGLYLFPPGRPVNRGYTYTPVRNVHISLKLSSELRLGSIYPWTVVETTGQREEAKWDVSTSPDGDITSQVSQERHYGGPSWELSPNDGNASASSPNNQKPGLPPQPPSGLLFKLLTPDTSVVLSVDDLFCENAEDVEDVEDAAMVAGDYLMNVLHTQLKLSMQMAQSFKNYLLRNQPRLQSAAGDTHGPRSIAITFVPHDQLEKIAPLHITPVPATTSRIFMLWGEVNTGSHTGPWAAWCGAELNPTTAFRTMDWAQVVGLDLEGQENKSEFTAIEWGMMKVPERYLVKDTNVKKAESTEREIQRAFWPWSDSSDSGDSSI